MAHGLLEEGIGVWVGGIKVKRFYFINFGRTGSGIIGLICSCLWFGVAETAVGKALEYRDSDIIIATKCGVLPDENNKPNRFISRKTILEEVEGSLRRLGRDCIDLYQIHWPNPPENLIDGNSAGFKSTG